MNIFFTKEPFCCFVDTTCLKLINKVVALRAEFKGISSGLQISRLINASSLYRC